MLELPLCCAKESQRIYTYLHYCHLGIKETPLGKIKVFRFGILGVSTGATLFAAIRSGLYPARPWWASWDILDDVEENLQHPVFHREYKRPKVFNPYYIYKKRELIQADLIDIQKIKNENDSYSYLLLLIDVFTRKVWVYHVKRKSAKEMKKIIEKWLRSLRQKPKVLETDAGREFNNTQVKNLLSANNIQYKIAVGTCKASFAERANKTIQILIYKYLTQNETLRYIDVLDNLVKSYNRRGHRSLRYLTPIEAERADNQALVRGIQILRFRKIKRKKPTLKPGDIVRIKTDSKQISSSRRAYAEQYHGEYYMVMRINKKLNIPLYFVKSLTTGSMVKGSFYSNELSRVRGDVFKIEKILKRKGRGRNRKVLVRWKYFGPRWDEWIYESEIVHSF